MNDLLELILAPLAGPHRRAVRQRWQERWSEEKDDVDPLHIFAGALQDVPETYAPEWWLSPALSGWWLCLRVDWKAADEVAWQVQAIARTLNLPAPLFVSSVDHQPGATLDVLIEAAVWLRRQHYELLLIDTGGDDYLAFPTGLEQLREAFRVTHSLSLTARLI